MRGRRPGHGNDRGAAQLTAPRALTQAVGAAELKRLLEEEPGLLLVYFWQPGCEPCRELLPQLWEMLAGSGGICRAVSVDVDQAPTAAAAHGVRRTPVVAFFREGRELHRFHGGALPPSVRRMVP